MISETKYQSWCTGELSKGCQLCVKGRKTVLFITGLCPQRCFYCPVSEEKFGHDVVYANEWKLNDPENPVELFKEAELTEARGAGITGGDPLVKVDRCCKYIRLLKEHFGREFHVHLYTSLKLVSREVLQKLYDAGLDEIRFHPNLDDNSLWHRLELAKDFDWAVGIEIPAIQGYEEKTKTLIDFAVGKVQYINFNELELSDTQVSHYKMECFVPKNDISYGVKGSQEMAMVMLKYAESKGLRAHFCTARLKNAVQMTNRLKLRAQHVALPFDIKTSEGLLKRGCVYLAGVAPDFNNAREKIISLGIKQEDIVVDDKKHRLIIPPASARKFAKKLKALGLAPALVEEYPTVDALETDVDFL